MVGELDVKVHEEVAGVMMTVRWHTLAEDDFDGAYAPLLSVTAVKKPKWTTTKKTHRA